MTLKPVRACSNCLKGTRITINKDVLCCLKGVVTYDYVCSRHRYAPEPKTKPNCTNCEYFMLGINTGKEITAMGFCKLFTVRQYDGAKKNACSKFVKRSRLEVS